MVNFYTQILASQPYSFGFIFLTLLSVLEWVSPYLDILIMLFFQFPLTFLQTQKGMYIFIMQIVTSLMLIGMVFMIIWEMFHWGTTLNLVLLLLIQKFVIWSRLELMCIYLSLKVSSQASFISSFSAAGAVAIAHTNQLFCLYQQSKSWNSDMLLIIAEEFLRLPN